jgi:hypothetical protein
MSLRQKFNSTQNCREKLREQVVQWTLIFKEVFRKKKGMGTRKLHRSSLPVCLVFKNQYEMTSQNDNDNYYLRLQGLLSVDEKDEEIFWSRRQKWHENHSLRFRS